MERQPWIPRDIVTAAKQMDLLTYLQRYDPGELVRLSPGVYSRVGAYRREHLCHPHPRQPKNLQWKMVLVVARDRWEKRAGLSYQGTGHGLPSGGTAYLRMHGEKPGVAAVQTIPRYSSSRRARFQAPAAIPQQ